MGAKKVVNYSKEGWEKEAGEDFDLILSTRDVAEGFPLADFLGLLDVHARFITVGLPDSPLPGLPAFAYVGNGALFGATHVGSKKEVKEMLELAAEKVRQQSRRHGLDRTDYSYCLQGIKTWIEELSMKDASKAVQGVKDNKVRYRYVLKQDIDP